MGTKSPDADACICTQGHRGRKEHPYRPFRHRGRLDVAGAAGKQDGTEHPGMGGIDLDAAYDAAGVPRETFESICAIAVGTRGTDSDLDPHIVKQNFANDRKPAGEIAFKGRFSQ